MKKRFLVFVVAMLNTIAILYIPSPYNTIPILFAIVLWSYLILYAIHIEVPASRNQINTLEINSGYGKCIVMTPYTVGAANLPKGERFVLFVVGLVTIEYEMGKTKNMTYRLEVTAGNPKHVWDYTDVKTLIAEANAPRQIVTLGELTQEQVLIFYRVLLSRQQDERIFNAQFLNELIQLCSQPTISDRFKGWIEKKIITPFLTKGMRHLKKHRTSPPPYHRRLNE